MRNKCWGFSFLGGLCALSMATGVSAETIVVRDHGGIDIGNYYTKSKVEEKPAYSLEQLKKDVQSEFPLTSTIRRGKSYQSKVKQELPVSIALVGTDEVSQGWLQRRVDDIRRTSAVVIVIDAPDLTTYSRFQAALSRADIMVTKSSSEPFEGLVDAYPVLIANGEVIQ